MNLCDPFPCILPQNAHNKSFEELNNSHAQQIGQLEVEHQKRQDELNKELERVKLAHDEQMEAFFRTLANPKDDDREQVFIWDN
jgi:hypothetical protein